MGGNGSKDLPRKNGSNVKSQNGKSSRSNQARATTARGDPPTDTTDSDSFEGDWSEPEDEAKGVSYFLDDDVEEENTTPSATNAGTLGKSEKKKKKKKTEEEEEEDAALEEEIFQNLPLTKEMNEKDEINISDLKLSTLEEKSAKEEDSLPTATKEEDVTKGVEGGEGDGLTKTADNIQEDEEEVVTKNPKGEITFRVEKFAKIKQTKKSKVVVTGDLAWRVSVPRPYSVNGSISIYIDVVELRPRRKHRDVRTCFTLSLHNEVDPQQNCFHKCEHVFSAVGDWGFRAFCSADTVLDPSNGFLISDALVVAATLEQLPAAEDADIDWNTYDSRDATGYVGLQNQGATCYMNSLLQTLYHTSAFTQAVFEMPTGTPIDEETLRNSSWEEIEAALKAEESIPQALQSLFFDLRFAAKAPSTKALTRSFGWDSEDSFTQHDVQELDRVLLDNLESKMVGTPLDGTIKRIFGGCLRHSIQCTDVDYESAREEVFYDLSLDVRGFRTIEESLAAYTAVEKLDGDNKYMAEGFGLQCAEKTTKFLKLPPVLHVQLKRWAFDLDTLEQKKVNARFEFSDKLDFAPYLDKTAPRDEVYMYRLHAVLIHSGSINGGHYHVYIRPTQEAKWYKFNDEIVTPSNISHVYEAGFGGEAETTMDTSGKTKTYNEKFSNACK